MRHTFRFSGTGGQGLSTAGLIFQGRSSHQ